MLYWLQMNRRVDSNHVLCFAPELADQRGLPLLVYGGLPCWYPYASDRLHTFIPQGVPQTERRLRKLGIGDMFHLRRRDPNGYTNILWCFGLHDRPWPERPIFGAVRYMSYEGMRRKTDVDAYIRSIEGAR
jgi:deoxyribodipyrimidine photolyase